MIKGFDHLLSPAIIFAVSVTALLLVRGVSFRLLQRWAAKTELRLDDLVVDAVKTPSLYWVLALGLYMAIGMSELPPKYARYIIKIIHILVIFSITIASANLAGSIFRNYIQSSNLPFPSTGLAYGILKGTIIVIGILIILSVLGISITPIITALGVGGLAVALALQDTLANLFAGIHILVEKSIRVGDFVRLENGQEGYVSDITWRTTRIRMLPNNMVIIPNSKLSQSIVTNYYLPDRNMSLSIPVSVSYSTDPDMIERILVEEAKKAVGKVPGLLGDPEPFVRFIPGFGASSLDFTLICQVQEFVGQYLVQHEIRKLILRRFREEGIEIPYPQQTIHIRNEEG
ncbi:MAG: mechanosensitive ion channel family protein [Nitrospiraceae bacterium]|nr:mechanosensitive ion channel family protein [Nitrospiraceae bacterium]